MFKTQTIIHKIKTPTTKSTKNLSQIITLNLANIHRLIDKKVPLWHSITIGRVHRFHHERYFQNIQYTVSRIAICTNIFINPNNKTRIRHTVHHCGFQHDHSNNEYSAGKGRCEFSSDSTEDTDINCLGKYVFYGRG